MVKMKNNKCAGIIYIIGVFVIILGIVGSFILGDVSNIEVYSEYGSHSEYNWSLSIFCAVSSLILGLILMGLGEMIGLLQDNLDQQSALYRLLSQHPCKNSNSVNTIQNTPNKGNYKVPHKWKCAKCGKMIDKKPCPYCGDNFN